MSMLKALIGGFFGGATGAYLVERIPDLIGLSGPWMILLAGLLAGIGTRLACGNNRSFATGMAGAIAAILAISAVSYLTSMQRAAAAEKSLTETTVPVKSPGTSELTTEDGLDEAIPSDSATAQSQSESSESGTAELDRPVDMQPAVDPWADTAVSNKRSRSYPRDTLPVSLALFHSLSALLAFVLGSGSGQEVRIDRSMNHDRAEDQ